MGSGYVEAVAGWQKSVGAYGRVETGMHPLPGVAIFGFGQVDEANGTGAGVGARWDW